MSNRILVIALVAAIAVSLLATGSAMAVRGGNSNGNGGGGGGGNFSGSIDIAAGGVGVASAELSSELSWGDDVMFMVDANVKERDLYKLYVTNQCYKDGVGVLSMSEPVIDGVAGPFTLGYDTWEGEAECTAWAWMFGSKNISGATMTYSFGS